eukprot:CAMPEP_0169083580 /NCGR_PEP_ID=MMETSP1015-20121227/12155_1 /TAXON_ID=342587 /ORGANISM="Karlodinium micrum, Strain CCMP2283" /LENGTH=197 /DNA_ID=CAMNT_0009143515 /DNA_START=55 /DNA_END=648 /DNA_ORIENTATION=+
MLTVFFAVPFLLHAVVLHADAVRPDAQANSQPAVVSISSNHFEKIGKTENFSSALTQLESRLEQSSSDLIEEAKKAETNAQKEDSRRKLINTGMRELADLKERMALWKDKSLHVQQSLDEIAAEHQSFQKTFPHSTATDDAKFEQMQKQTEKMVQMMQTLRSMKKERDTMRDKITNAQALYNVAQNLALERENNEKL